MVLTFRVCAPNAGCPDPLPGQGTRSHRTQQKILHAAMKIPYATAKSATLIKKKKFPSWWHREQICGSPGRGWGRKKWEFGISRGKLLCIGCINKVLLYNRRNYTQYPIIKHHGKEYIHTQTCITESLFYTEEINTTL